MKFIYHKLCIAFILCSFFGFINSKVLQKVYPMSIWNKEDFKYVTKFSFEIGDGKLLISGKFTDSVEHLDRRLDKIDIKFLAFLDDDWPQVQAAKTCQEKEDLARLKINLPVPTDARPSNVMDGYLTQKLRTRVWYFAWSDCERQFARFITPGNKLNVELKFINSDGSHFSAEDNGMTWWYFLELIILIGFFCANSVKFYRFYLTQESLDLPFLILNVAIFLECISVSLELWHLLLYSQNGHGNFVLDFLSQASGVFSQFIIVLLVILISSGWSIDFYKIQELNLYLPLSIMVGLFHFIIVGLGRIKDSSKFHDYEGVSGWIIMLFKLFFFIIFIFLIKNTYRNASTNNEKKNFIKSFSLFGTIYLLALPILVLISNILVAPYVRNKVIILGTLTLQIGSSIILTYLLSSKKSKYHQISMKGRTLLPSGKLD